MTRMEIVPKDLPAVMRGARMQRRRLLVNAPSCWASARADGSLALDAGRALDGRTIIQLPPCEPKRIIGQYPSHSPRGVESRATPRNRLRRRVTS